MQKNLPRWTRFDRVMLAAAVLFLPAELFLAHFMHLAGVAHFFANLSIILTALIVIPYLCRGSVSAKAMGFLETGAAAAVSAFLLRPLPEIVARFGRPLQDAALAGWDQRLHFSTAHIVQLTRGVPALQHITSLVYLALGPLILAALFVPPCFRRADLSLRFIGRIALGLLFTLGAFALFPAAGPWTIEPYRPTAQQAAVATHLDDLNSSAPAAMSNGAVISFPSFHVIAAMLAAAALSETPRLRVVGWLLAALISASTIITGWHYGVDVLGGLLVAIITIYVTRPARIRHSAIQAEGEAQWNTVCE